MGSGSFQGATCGTCLGQRAKALGMACKSCLGYGGGIIETVQQGFFSNQVFRSPAPPCTMCVMGVGGPVSASSGDCAVA